MGKIRARTGKELSARKNEILDAAARQLMTMDYDAVTLASLAAETSVSRPSMYHYYEKRETVFADLLIREYGKFTADLQPFMKRKMGRETFCRKLTSVLMNRKLMLKLHSLNNLIFEKLNEDEISRFMQESASDREAFIKILNRQFPDADENTVSMFIIQFSAYCSSLYGTCLLPQIYTKLQNIMDDIPEGEKICCQGLMLLSAMLKPE